MEQRIYLDNAATTAIDPRVLTKMQDALTQVYGNASSIHGAGRAARKLTEQARRQVAAALNAAPQEIYFTAGGSESDNWALKGAAFSRKRKGKHIITSAVEHHAILHSCDWLREQGFEITVLPVDKDGLVSPESLQSAIREDTALVSVMLANNEIGTIQPIRQLADIAHAHGALMHTDAVQAVGSIPVDVNALGVDLLSLSAHKFHGPKGVGAMYIRKGVVIDSLIHGGAQERGKRAGTDNTPGIVGLGEAISIAVNELDANAARMRELRDRLMQGILAQIPQAQVNGGMTDRLPGNLNVSFLGVEGEALLLRLDLAGVCASSGSACTSGSLDPSHVLMAIGLTPQQAAGSLRFSVGTDNTVEEIDRTLAILPGIVQNLRDLTRGVFTDPGCKIEKRG